MDSPSQLLDRIRRRRAHSEMPRRSPSPRVPAPAPADPGIAAPAARNADPPGAQALPKEGAAQAAAPRPAGGHGLYSQLMRSHDRMGTRHLTAPAPPAAGPGGGAPGR